VVKNAPMEQQNSSRSQAIGEILVGCLRLWIFWLWLAMVGALVVWVMVVPKGFFDAWHAWLWPFYGMLSGYIVAMLLVEQFTSYRWRLVPGYRTTCLLSGGILGVLFLSITGALVVQGSPERLAAAGLTVLAFSLGLWLIVRPWAPIVCLPLPLALLPLKRLMPDGPTGLAAPMFRENSLLPLKRLMPGWPTDLAAPISRENLLLPVAKLIPDWPARLFAPAETWAGNLCCALLGAIILAQFVRWLVALDEDYPANAWRSVPLRLATRWKPLPATPRLEKWSGRWQDWWFERTMSRGPRCFGWTVRRWSLGGLPPATEAGLLCVVAANFLLTRLLGFPVTGAFVVSLVQVCGSFLVFLIHIQRRPMLAIESLRPVTRQQLVRQMGAMVLARLVALMAILVIVGMIAALWPKSTSSLFPPTGPRFSLALWPPALALFFVLIGLLVWLRTVGPMSLEIVAAIVGGCAFILLAMFPLALAPDFEVTSISLPVGVAIVLLLTGISLFRSAYRRWQSIELG
jgi:hypothetical protein